MGRYKELFLGVRRYLQTFWRWLAVAGLTGSACGLVGSAFNLAVGRVTELRTASPQLMWLLPLGGVFIAALYRVTKTEGEGTNNIIDSIRFGEKVPLLLVPVIFIATTVTHLLGGSAGREGAALQIGGGIGYQIGRAIKLDDKDMRLVTLCGMSAVFSALFGTPLTATVFALEVISVGILHYSGLIPCLAASLVAYAISRLLGIEPTHYALAAGTLDVLMVVRVTILAVICAAVSIVFCVAMHKTEHWANKLIKNSFLRAAAGGFIIIGLSRLLGTNVYNGTGEHVIESAIANGTAPDLAFLWKIVFTAVTIGFGFRGGEIVPTFFIGATLGCAVGAVLGMPPQLAAAIGLTAMFCGAVNCPIASIILSVELFGSGGLIYFALACGISYMLSGYFGIYSSQKIMYSKTRAEFIDRFAE